ncbi:zinc finger protein 501-like [Ptychodera flava]|uniref:zinc finger protein 501-like n=1 Tax=Ptychodera flava TaxID=63121 RepID=UPI00396A76C3
MAANKSDAGDDALKIFADIEGVAVRSPVHSSELDPESVETGDFSNGAVAESGIMNLEERVHSLEVDVDSIEAGDFPDEAVAGQNENTDAAERVEGEDKRVSYSCEVCDKVYQSKTGLRKHTRKHTGKFPFNCFCGKGFSERRHLKEHSCTHSGKGIKKCKVCGFEPKSFKGMKWHEASHIAEIHSCNECPKIFNFKMSLKQHQQGCHTKKYTCTCGKTFGLKSRYTTHLKTHSGNKEFRCSSCDYQTYRKGDLMKHQISKHSNARDFVCALCGQSFKTKDALSKHEARKRPCHNTTDHLWEDC